MNRTRARRRRRKWGLVLAALVLLAAGCAAAWLLWPREADRSLASAQAPAGQVRGWAPALTGETGLFTRALTHEELAALCSAQAAEADVRGMNALFLPLVSDEEGALFRDRAVDTLPVLTQHDTLFSRADGLAAFCDAANERGLAVYGVVEQADLAAGGDALAGALARVMKRYPVAGIYVHTPAADETAPFSRYAGYAGEPALDGVEPGAWADGTALFLRTRDEDFAGAVFDASMAARFPERLGIMLSAMDGGVPPALLSYTPSAQLAVSYPAQGAVVYTSSCFVMGTSDPAQELLLNGQPVARAGSAGVFGVLVELTEGENTLTFTQGAQSAALTLVRPAPKTGTAQSTGEMPHDDTQPAEAGEAVQVTGWIASLLYDPSSDGNINETVRRGAVATVQDSVQTVRSGKTTWAYRLSSGDYILAGNVQRLGTDVARPVLTGAEARAFEWGEELTFGGAGTPLAYTNMREDGALVVHFYDADIAADFAVQASALVASVETRPLADGTGAEIVFAFTSPLWGHSIEYEDGVTKLLLHASPARGQDPARPLAGTTVLLDPGHGDTDTGAMGAAGAGAPAEKDVNLAVALAAKYRLEQMGASVEMVRADDTFLSLEQRNAMITALQPDFFISIHHNSVDLSVDANAATGVECYYFYDAGRALAQALVQNVTAATGRADRGAMWGYYYVTRNTACPAVLLETGFMVNPCEYEQVTSEEAIWATGDAVARSVLACVPGAQSDE